jgi:hypothetical protein
MGVIDRFLQPIVIAVALAFSLVRAGAADIRVDPSFGGTAGLILEGEIKPGDFDAFKRRVLGNDAVTDIYLASPGGNVGEAMKIGDLVRRLNISTVIPGKPLTNQALAADAARHSVQNIRKDYMCASACFFIFVAGIHRSADVPGSAILGIHRPFLSKDSRERLDLDQATLADDQAKVSIERYLSAMNVPAKYAENMYTVPKNKILWIRNDEFDADFNGFIQAFRDIALHECAPAAEQKKQKPPSDQPAENLAKGGNMSATTATDCERTVQSELAARGREAAFRLNGGNLRLGPGTLSPQLPK